MQVKPVSLAIIGHLTLQGFQLLADVQDGFGGVANEICAHMLHEQFPKKAVWFNGIVSPSLHVLQVLKNFVSKINRTLYNTARLTSNITEY